MTIKIKNMNNKENLKSIVESLLFVSGESIEIKKLVSIVGQKKDEIEKTIVKLAEDYKINNRGIRVLRNGDKVSMVTAKENGEYIQKMMQNDMDEDLSKSAMESLSIIAYRGPISRGDLEQIRGVNCSFVLRKLLIRGLIERVNNSQDARTYLYQPTFDLLKKLGVEKIENLPNYEELSKKQILAQAYE